jgi:hypothetical protein
MPEEKRLKEEEGEKKREGGVLYRPYYIFYNYP